MIKGYTAGVFDLFHVGHLNLIEKAKEECDYLIVAVSTDELVMAYKGYKPIISFNERKRIVEAIKAVDEVVPQYDRNKINAYKKYQFQKMFVGDDWYNTDKWNKYEEEFKKEGIKIVYFPYTKGISSTKINEDIKKR